MGAIFNLKTIAIIINDYCVFVLVHAIKKGPCHNRHQFFEAAVEAAATTSYTSSSSATSVRSSKESVVGRRSMQPDINNYCIDLLQPQKAKATGIFVLQTFIFATCKFIIWYFIIEVDTIL